MKNVKNRPKLANHPQSFILKLPHNRVCQKNVNVRIISQTTLIVQILQTESVRQGACLLPLEWEEMELSIL